MTSILSKDNSFGSCKSAKNTTKLKKHLHFSPDIEDNWKTCKESLKQIHIPVQAECVQSVFHEFEHVRHALNVVFQLNRDALRKQTTFAQSIAYRVLGSIDWTCADFGQIEQLFKTRAKDDVSISKEQGKFIKLSEVEVKQGVYEWILWRIKYNNSLIDSSKHSYDMKHLPFAFDDNKTKQTVCLYMIAKWANDNSSLDFGSYMHYGLPRARIRTHANQSDTHNDAGFVNLSEKVNQTISNNSSGFLSGASSVDLSNESSLTTVTIPNSTKTESNKLPSPQITGYYNGKIKVKSILE
jgi:hypothetical protein